MKYQLNVYWKNGDISGRVIQVPWRFTHDLTTDLDHVELLPHEIEEAPAPSEESTGASET